MRKKFALLILPAAAICLLAAWPAHAQSSRNGNSAWLGIYTQTVDKEIAETFKLPSSEGVMVNRVIDDSPADKAGLREDDIILKFNNQTVNSANDLTRLVRRSDVDEKITLNILRDGNPMDLTVTLSSRGEDFDWSESTIPDVPDVPGVPKISGIPHTFYFSTDDQAYLGVSLNSLSDQLADYFGVQSGTLVSEVDEDSPAAKAGIKAGDIITQVGDEKITDAGDVREIISDMKDGEKTTITIVRNKQNQTLTVAPEIDKSNSRHRGSFYTTDIPKIKLNLPKTRGLWYGSPGNGSDSDDLQKDLDDLRKEMDRAAQGAPGIAWRPLGKLKRLSRSIPARPSPFRPTRPRKTGRVAAFWCCRMWLSRIIFPVWQPSPSRKYTCRGIRIWN